MKLTLKRNKYQPDGVFGELLDDNGKLIAATLEHAYADGNGNYVPKIQVGTYTCERGTHKLEHMTTNFETFEVNEVPYHSNILFHVGNYNRDSDGCILLGDKVIKAVPQANANLMITNSKMTFAKFMELMKGIDSFTLCVE